MKKFFCSTVILLLIICFVVGSVLAEENKQSGGFFDSVGSFISNTWNDASAWVSGAWGDATKWIDGAWGDASQWVEQAWNDSSAWVSDIWGDASTWVSDTYENASGAVNAWWANTFNSVTEKGKNTWAWFEGNFEMLKTYNESILEKVKNAVTETGNSASEKVQATIYELLGQLNIAGIDADRVWNTINAYSEQKGISTLSTCKLMLPYLLQLCADSVNQETANIPAVAIAQYLTGVIEKLGISTNDTANELIVELTDTLSSI